MDIFDGIVVAEAVATVFYALLGLALFVVSYIIIDKLTHFQLHEEIAERKNVAVAIMIGSVAISLSILISSVIR
jgi:putative membrane protein